MVDDVALNVLVFAKVALVWYVNVEPEVNVNEPELFTLTFSMPGKPVAIPIVMIEADAEILPVKPSPAMLKN